MGERVFFNLGRDHVVPFSPLLKADALADILSQEATGQFYIDTETSELLFEYHTDAAHFTERMSWNYDLTMAGLYFPYRVDPKGKHSDDTPQNWCKERLGAAAWECEGGDPLGERAEWTWFYTAGDRAFYFKSDDAAFEFKLMFG